VLNIATANSDVCHVENLCKEEGNNIFIAKPNAASSCIINSFGGLHLGCSQHLVKPLQSLRSGGMSEFLKPNFRP